MARPSAAAPPHRREGVPTPSARTEPPVRDSPAPEPPARGGLAAILREEWRHVREEPGRNLLAGVTVAMVALPLALAFGAQAFGDAVNPVSGISGPAAGLWAAIVAGALAALLGGTRAQITGPDAVIAFFVVTLVASHGIEFALLVIIVAGILQIAFGLANLGRIIEFIPYPVIAGFMNGSALVILWRQVAALAPSGTGAWRAVVEVLTGAAPREVYAAWGVALATAGVMLLAIRYLKRIPAALVALLLATAATALLAAFVPALAAMPHIPALSAQVPHPSLHFGAWNAAWTRDLVLGAFSLALLCSINTLLTSVVADSVTGAKSDARRELVGQGIANGVSGLLGGMAASGAPVRTLVNLRSGGRTRLSGLAHSVTLLLVLVLLGGLAVLVPMAALSGILLVTAWNMMDRESILNLRKTPVEDAFVMLFVTFVTVAVDLVWAVTLGVVLASLLFIKRWSDLSDFVTVASEESDVERSRSLGISGEVVTYHVRGPLFFGAANRFSQGLQRATDAKVVIFRMEVVTTVDQTGMRTLANVVSRLQKEGRRVLVAGLPHGSFVQFERYGLVGLIGRERFHPTSAAALVAAHALLRGAAPASGMEAPGPAESR